LRDRQHWLAREYKRTEEALRALEVLSDETTKSNAKPKKAQRRPRGSITEAIRAAAVVPVKAGEIAAKYGLTPQSLAVQMSKMAKRGELIRVGVGLYQRADCVKTAAQREPAPVDAYRRQIDFVPAQ
jgi:hypothetical protein